MDIFYDLCSGGGGAALGAARAGINPQFGLECDPLISDAYNLNLGPHCHIGLIQDFDYTSLSPPFWLHASPPCTTASLANQRASESPNDLAMSEAVSLAIRMLQPPRFSLENVAGYGLYQSFQNIKATLRDCGYAIDHWLLDAADYGVAQNRRRLILVASKNHQPCKPVQTHHNPRAGQLSLFTEPWRGWWSAVKHRVHEFEDDDWANWQIPRLPKEYRESFLIGGGNNSFAEAKSGKGVRFADEPAHTLTAASRRTIRAFIMHGGNTGAYGNRYRYADEPSFTVTANGQKIAHRAFIVSGQDATIRYEEQPSFTVCASPHQVSRAHVRGHVVRLSLGALADIQSFPTEYKLPSNKTLATRIIGNAVPPLLMQRIVEANQ